MKKLGRKIAFFSVAVLAAAIAAGNVVCYGVLGVDFINGAFNGSGANTIDEQTELKSSSLVKKISEDGTVLLKNENHTLPLDINANNKVNVFGYSALDNAWVFTGVGSGSCKPDPQKRIGILKGLENAGFEYNKEIIDAYKKAIPTKDDYLSRNANGKIIQPDKSIYSDSMINNAKAFSDTAIVVLSRATGENCGEVPTTSVDYRSGKEDKDRNYLQLGQKEEDRLDIVKNNFSKVIVLLNTTNNRQCDFLKDDKISAALYCGPTGVSGAESVANLLAGQKTVKKEDGSEEIKKISPSGKLADTYAYDYTSEPSYANRRISDKSATGGSIVYQEGIYIGYRWYETADQMGFFSGLENGYDSAVLYPFGYGLSYTSFDWEVTSVSLPTKSELKKDSSIEVKVKVTNTGDYPGKDVVELYYTVPYIEGEIEKSSVTLGDFAKTSVLNPGESQERTLNVSAYSRASYDCYDKNNDGHKGYELDKGDYTLELRTDSHHAKERKNGQSSVFDYHISQTIDFDKDPVTDYDVINRFTGDDSYARVDLDGSNVGINATYLSREDFVATFVDKTAKTPSDKAKVDKAHIHQSHAEDVEERPTFGQDKGLYLVTKEDGSKASAADLDKGTGLKFNDVLVDELRSDYNSPKWDDLVSQASKDDVCNLVEKSGFGSASIESIGKTKTLDFDGPSGFNQNTQKIAEDSSSWTSYPSECLVGCTWNVSLANELGKSMAFEAKKSGINGLYAPGVNLHRSNFNGRNYEYYSEDPIISGKLASATIKGAKSGGLYCYLKHFAVSEEGDNPKGVDTWLTEQTLRELYLKPFEIAVKDGANAIRTAFNRVGAVWAGACYDLCTEILRNEWGFKGSVVTDWSSGDNIRNTPRGVIAGNDRWLNPRKNNGAPLNKDDPTQRTCAKNALKHNVYTYISTYQYARDYKSEDDEYFVAPGITQKGESKSWWQPVLISLDVLVGLATIGLGFYAFFPFEKYKKPKK